MDIGLWESRAYHQLSPISPPLGPHCDELATFRLFFRATSVD